MVNPRVSLTKWESVKVACVDGGFSLRQAAEHFDIEYEAIKSKAYRDEWQTPGVMKEKVALALREVKAEEMEVLKEKIRGERVDFVAKREEHRQRMMEVTDDVLTKLIDNGFDHIKIKSVRDLDTLDTIARRTLGVDLEDAAGSKLMTLDFSSVAPAKVAQKPVIDVD